MREILLDTETTGLNPFQGHRVIEIGAVELLDRCHFGREFQIYINPDRDIPIEAYNVHKISAEFLMDKPRFHEIAEEFIDFIADSPLVIHNAPFDLKFLNHELKLCKRPVLHNEAIDTVILARNKFPGQSVKLDILCDKFNISRTDRIALGHGALLDSKLLGHVYIELTGGRQTKLFAEPEHQISASFKPERNIKFQGKLVRAAEEDLEAHRHFVSKIKNNIWEGS